MTEERKITITFTDDNNNQGISAELKSSCQLTDMAAGITVLCSAFYQVARQIVRPEDVIKDSIEESVRAGIERAKRKEEKLLCN